MSFNHSTSAHGIEFETSFAGRFVWEGGVQTKQMK